MDAVRIPMTNGGFSLVDERDAAFILAVKWHKRTTPNGTSYAFTGQLARTVRPMHQIILGGSTGFCIDHIDRDGLNNTRANLRFATTSQNAANKRKQVGKYTSRFKGVHFRKDTRRWRAFIEAQGRRIILGNFHDEEDAARAYDAAATMHFGEYARLNFPVASLTP